MKKEVVLAIIIGFAVGLLITFGIYTARTALDSSQPSPTPAPIISDSQDATASANLNITSPANEELFDIETIPLQGTSLPEAIITVISPAGQQIITADKEGKFETEIDLEGGINPITVSAFTLQGEKSEINLTVVFSTAKI